MSGYFNLRFLWTTLQLASDAIKREYTQSLFDKANYTYEEKNGNLLVQQVKDSLGDYFSKKRRAAQVSTQKQFSWLITVVVKYWQFM